MSRHWFELSNQIDCKLYFSLRLESNLAGRIALAGGIPSQFYQRFLVLQLGGLIFFKYVICNKQILTCLEPDIVFIHSFLIPYRSRA